jgi:hypothetical protein
MEALAILLRDEGDSRAIHGLWPGGVTGRRSRGAIRLFAPVVLEDNGPIVVKKEKKPIKKQHSPI